MLYDRHLSIDSMVALGTIVAIKSYIELYSRTVFPDGRWRTRLGRRSEGHKERTSLR
jgi:hypothetical protein